MRLLDETKANAPENYPAFLLAENVKGLRPYIPTLVQELESRGYEAHIQLYNSKYWNVPQNRERYFIVATRKDDGDFTFPEEQHEYVPKLSASLDKNVDEKYYIPDEKAQTIIQQALLRLQELGKVHPCITPDRVEKRQNGRRAKEDEAEMFTLTAQDIHGVIIEDADEIDVVEAICGETGLLNPDGQGKTLRVGGGVIDKETQLSARFGECVQDGVIQKQRNGHGTFFGLSPTLLSTDYKGPHLLIQNKEEQ
jgi:DNA (cytosine-5)-methyltransferase 1